MKIDTRSQSDILHQGHWDRLDYEQRVTRHDWQIILLNHYDRISYRGNVYQLLAMYLGGGVYLLRKHGKPGMFFKNPTVKRFED